VLLHRSPLPSSLLSSLFLSSPSLSIVTSLSHTRFLSYVHHLPTHSFSTYAISLSFTMLPSLSSSFSPPAPHLANDTPLPPRGSFVRAPASPEVKPAVEVRTASLKKTRKRRDVVAVGSSFFFSPNFLAATHSLHYQPVRIARKVHSPLPYSPIIGLMFLSFSPLEAGRKCSVSRPCERYVVLSLGFEFC
jgi:hypothetical protein